MGVVGGAEVGEQAEGRAGKRCCRALARCPEPFEIRLVELSGKPGVIAEEEIVGADDPAPRLDEPRPRKLEHAKRRDPAFEKRAEIDLRGRLRAAGIGQRQRPIDRFGAARRPPDGPESGGVLCTPDPAHLRPRDTVACRWRDRPRGRTGAGKQPDKRVEDLE